MRPGFRCLFIQQILRMLILLMLILLISAHDHHLAPPATGTRPPLPKSWWPNTTFSFL
jgi:hypothetical protein